MAHWSPAACIKLRLPIPLSNLTSGGWSEQWLTINPGAQVRNQVNINEGHEVRYWTQKWDVTKERLMAAVKKAGVSCRKSIGEEVTIQIDVFYRSSNGERLAISAAQAQPWSGGDDTDTAVQEFLDRTGTSPENMALRALLEKLDDKI